MPFKIILRELMDSVPSASGAILADWEGESVEQCCSYDVYDLKVIGAHNGILLTLMKDLHAKLAVGALEHAVISTPDKYVVLGPIGPEYFLVMTLEKSAVLAQAVQYFKEALVRLYKEIY